MMRTKYTQHSDAHGCLGIMRVFDGAAWHFYLVLVTGCASVGKIYGGSEVYRWVGREEDRDGK